MTGCTDELRMSLAVYVIDAITGASAASGATLIVHSAAFQDSVMLTRDGPYRQFEDAAGGGVYQIVVRKPGYRDWSQSGIRIESDRCHVESPAIVTALLQPQ